ncbi:unnamed protein product [Lathyrus sativus]|nr:unnamed protein product [Lathyrus sativus]
MAGFISKSKTLIPSKLPNPSSFMASSLRYRSSRAATKPQLLEIDTSSTSLSSEGEHEMTLKLFDDLIHRILVKKATPDWLPFVPGSSFWVPPRPTPSNVVHLVHKLTDGEKQQPFMNDESLSLSSLRGWPSSNYFIKGNVHGGDSGVELNIPEGMEGPVKVKVMTLPEHLAHSEDEDEP